MKIQFLVQDLQNFFCEYSFSDSYLVHLSFYANSIEMVQKFGCHRKKMEDVQQPPDSAFCTISLYELKSKRKRCKMNLNLKNWPIDSNINNSQFINKSISLDSLDLDEDMIERIKSTETSIEDSLIPFPQKLYMMLCPANAEIIEWLPHGKAFRCKDPKRLVDEVLPKYFKHNKMASFQRQLNLYGFKRLNRRYSDYGGYFHSLFCQGREDLLTSIKRIKKVGSSSQSTDNDSTEEMEFRYDDSLQLPPLDQKLDDSLPLSARLGKEKATYSLRNSNGTNTDQSSIYQSSDSPNTHPLSTSIGSSSIFPPDVRRGLSISKVSLNSTPSTSQSSSTNQSQISTLVTPPITPHQSISQLSTVPESCTTTTTTTTDSHIVDDAHLYQPHYFDTGDLHTSLDDTYSNDLYNHSLPTHIPPPPRHLSRSRFNSYDLSATSVEYIDFNQLFETATNSTENSPIYQLDTPLSDTMSPTLISSSSLSPNPILPVTTIKPIKEEVDNDDISSNNNNKNNSIMIQNKSCSKEEEMHVNQSITLDSLEKKSPVVTTAPMAVAPIRELPNMIFPPISTTTNLNRMSLLDAIHDSKTSNITNSRNSVSTTNSTTGHPTTTAHHIHDTDRMNISSNSYHSIHSNTNNRKINPNTLNRVHNLLRDSPLMNKSVTYPHHEVFSYHPTTTATTTIMTPTSIIYANPTQFTPIVRENSMISNVTTITTPQLPRTDVINAGYSIPHDHHYQPQQPHNSKTIHTTAADTLSNLSQTLSHMALTTPISSTLLHQLEDQLVSTIKSWVNTSLIPSLTTNIMNSSSSSSHAEIRESINIDQGQDYDDALTDVTSQQVQNIKNHVNDILESKFGIPSDTSVRSNSALPPPPQSIYIHSTNDMHRTPPPPPSDNNNHIIVSRHNSNTLSCVSNTFSNSTRPVQTHSSTPSSIASSQKINTSPSPLFQSLPTAAIHMLNSSFNEHHMISSSSSSHACMYNTSGQITYDRQDMNKLHTVSISGSSQLGINKDTPLYNSTDSYDDSNNSTDSGSRKRQLSPQKAYIKKKQTSEAYYKALKAINEYAK